MPPVQHGSSRQRLGFHALVLTIGFIVGGTLQEVARLFLPAGAAKEFLTAGVTPYLSAHTINLLLIRLTLGPVTIDVCFSACWGF
jgi:hypothetical protein